MNNFEICIECGEETGRAGILEDSLYIEESGPFCENCYEEKIENTSSVQYLHEQPCIFHLFYIQDVLSLNLLTLGIQSMRSLRFQLLFLHLLQLLYFQAFQHQLKNSLFLKSLV